MFASYTEYVNRVGRPAFLWMRRAGMVHANSAAVAVATDLERSESFARSAGQTLETKSAQVVTSSFGSVLLVPLIDPLGRVDVLVGIAGAHWRDLPEILHQAHESTQYFSQVVHLLPQIVLTARPGGTFDYASRRWFEITGGDPHDARIPDLFYAALPQGDFEPFTQAWQKGIAGGAPFEFEIRLQTLAGARWHAVRATPWLRHAAIRKWVVTLEDRQEAARDAADQRDRLA